MNPNTLLDKGDLVKISAPKNDIIGTRHLNTEVNDFIISVHHQTLDATTVDEFAKDKGININNQATPIPLQNGEMGIVLSSFIQATKFEKEYLNAIGPVLCGGCLVLFNKNFVIVPTGFLEKISK
jgi:hypothetical protein